MNRKEYLLSCISEECAEISKEFADISSHCSDVAIRASKMLRFGGEEIQPGQLLNNAERLALELGDLLAVGKMLVDEGIIPETHSVNKTLKVEKFIRYAKSHGAIDGPI